MLTFLNNHLDTIVTIVFTIVGFGVNIYVTKKNFQNEIRKDKISRTNEIIQSLPYDICRIMDSARDGDFQKDKLNDILAKVISYGSKDAIKIAIKMQRNTYVSSPSNDKKNSLTALATYSLLITQLKYDLTSEVVSPESWLQMKITDYPEVEANMKTIINELIRDLKLNKDFRV